VVSDLAHKWGRKYSPDHIDKVDADGMTRQTHERPSEISSVNRIIGRREQGNAGAHVSELEKSDGLIVAKNRTNKRGAKGSSQTRDEQQPKAQVGIVRKGSQKRKTRRTKSEEVM